jgi:hypothetical protein
MVGAGFTPPRKGYINDAQVLAAARIRDFAEITGIPELNKHL